jgi:hypothetical protein
MHVVDIIKNLVTNLSDTKPVLFQRDGELYIITPQAFGRIERGISAPADATQLIVDKDKNKYHDKEYLIPIMKTETMTFDTMTTCASKLAALPEDGKIRIVKYSGNYGRFGNTFVNDGKDLELETAVSMDLEEYLQLIRKKEDDIFAKHGKYADSFVVTPYVLATFPRMGKVGYHDAVWSKYTPFYPGTGHSSLNFHESPHGLHVIMNNHYMRADDAEIFAKMASEYSTDMRKTLEAISIAMHELSTVPLSK